MESDIVSKQRPTAWADQHAGFVLYVMPISHGRVGSAMYEWSVHWRNLKVASGQAISMKYGCRIARRVADTMAADEDPGWS